MFQYGDPFVLANGAHDSFIPATGLAGQRTRPTVVRATGRTGLVIVIFHPWGAAPLFGALDEIADSIVPLAELVDSGRVAAVEDRLQQAGSGSERVRIVERFLLELVHGQRPDARVVDAVHRLSGPADVSSVGDVATRVGTSRRHLVRLFRSTVGIPPKGFQRIRRFQDATQERRLGLRWCDVAQASGYYDQAHLIHDFSDLAEATPAQLEADLDCRPLNAYFNTGQSERVRATIYL